MPPDTPPAALADTARQTAPTTQQRFGPVVLAPGILPRHVASYLFAAFLSIGLYTYLVALTPFVLRVNLGLPDAAQGRLSGDLQFWQELALLATIGWWGALSDRVGRRPVYVAGFVILAAAYALYPFAGSVTALTAARLVFALGVAATTTLLAAILADYPDEGSRGKLTGIAFFLNGLGSVLFFVGLTRMPDLFARAGAPELWAGRYAYLVVAGLALVGALVLLGLKPGRPAGTRERIPVRRLMAEGLAAARRPRIAVAYLSAFAARADMAIITIFLTLWVVQSAAAGADTAGEATARAGMTVAVAQLAALVWAPIFGFVADRVDRLALLVVAFALATLGYAWVGSLDDVLGAAAIPALVCLGIGQASAILASTVLLGEAAPVEIRGSVFGVQAFCGAVGILAMSAGGGRLYDGLGPHAPFAAVAAANGLVFLCAALVRAGERRRAAPVGPAA